MMKKKIISLGLAMIIAMSIVIASETYRVETNLAMGGNHIENIGYLGFTKGSGDMGIGVNQSPIFKCHASNPGESPITYCTITDHNGNVIMQLKSGIGPDAPDFRISSLELTSLSGNGNAYLCINEFGEVYRSETQCV